MICAVSYALTRDLCRVSPACGRVLQARRGLGLGPALVEIAMECTTHFFNDINSPRTGWGPRSGGCAAGWAD